MMTLSEVHAEFMKDPEYAREWERLQRIAAIQRKYPGGVLYRCERRKYHRRRNVKVKHG